MEQILWILAAVSFFIGFLKSHLGTKISAFDWMLAGFGFISLTFVV